MDKINSIADQKEFMQNTATLEPFMRDASSQELTKIDKCNSDSSMSSNKMDKSESVHSLNDDDLNISDTLAIKTSHIKINCNHCKEEIVVETPKVKSPAIIAYCSVTCHDKQIDQKVEEKCNTSPIKQ